MNVLNIHDLAVPKDLDAAIDTTKNRLEIHLDGENAGRIIAYYPIENLQVYVYEINGVQIPDMWDLGLRTNVLGNYLRTLICRHGHGEFTDNGVNLNLSGGEFSVKTGTKSDNRFQFTADSLIGVEFVLQVDDAPDESILLGLLRTSLSNMGVRYEDFQSNQWYFSDFDEGTKRAADRLLHNCFNSEDSTLILINVAEIGYHLGKEYKASESKERKYPTNLQAAIAGDMHRQLTENYADRITASMFAEKYSLSDTTVKNYFKNVYGYSYKEYQMKVRMEKAAQLLETTGMKIVEIAVAVGYATQAKFIDAFKKYYRMTPSEYRRFKKLGDILYS